MFIVEIHGLRAVDSNNMRRRIFELFKDTPYSKKVLVEPFHPYAGSVTDSNGRESPFLRLVCTGHDFPQQVVNKLKTLKIALRMRLESIIPAN